MQSILQEIIKKTWNIRHLVDEPFVPATQRIILKIVGFVELELAAVMYEKSKHSPESEAFQFLAFGH